MNVFVVYNGDRCNNEGKAAFSHFADADLYQLLAFPDGYVEQFSVDAQIQVVRDGLQQYLVRICLFTGEAEAKVVNLLDIPVSPCVSDSTFTCYVHASDPEDARRKAHAIKLRWSAQGKIPPPPLSPEIEALKERVEKAVSQAFLDRCKDGA